MKTPRPARDGDSTGLASGWGPAVRLLRRRPGFAVLASLALALGIGANSTVFSAVYAILLAPLPFAAPERLVVMWKAQPQLGTALIEVSYPEFREWQRQSRSFAGGGLGAVSASAFKLALTGRERPQSLTGTPVSGELLAVLGARPSEGRLLTPQDDRPGAERVAVLSDGLRRRLFGAPRGGRAAVGQRLTLSGQGYTVVGVLPPGFDYPAGTELWVPAAAVAPEYLEQPIGFLRVVGRLAPGVSAERARQEMNGIARRAATLYQTGDADPSAAVVPIAEHLVGATRQGLWILFGVVALVLLIACADVANLLLARSAGRGPELAIRSALGADRGRLVRLLLAESLPLAVLGGLGGLALAALGIRLFKALGPAEVPRLAEVRLSLPVIFFTLLLSLLTLALAAGLPAVRTARRVDFREALVEGGGGAMRGRRSRRFMSLLLAAQAAMAVVLLAAAGILVSHLRNLQRIDLGFEPRGLLTAEILLPEDKYAEVPRQRAFFDALIERLKPLPGVESAAAVLLRPLEGEIGWDLPVTTDGQTREQHLANPRVNLETVSPGYFKTLGIPLVAGRDFSPSDRPQAVQVAIVSESLAERLWPGQEALGKRLHGGPPGGPSPWLTVVGVVGDVRYRGLTRPTIDLYAPYSQAPLTPAHILVKTAGDPLKLARALEREVWAIDRDQPVAGVTTMEARVAAQLAGPRLLASLTGLFSGLATVLSALGIYGVIAYSASRRTREIGLRLALGATRGRVLRLVAQEGLAPAMAGAAVGLLAAFWLRRALARWLAAAAGADPWVLAAVVLFLLITAGLAIYLPARRATRLAPSLALRAE